MNDDLLNSLTYLCKYYSVSTSNELLISGLPLNDGRLTTQTFHRAAERAGFSVKKTQYKLTEIPKELLPIVLMLKDGRSCVVVDYNESKSEFEIVHSDGHSQVEFVSYKVLESRYNGDCFLIKKCLSFDKRSPSIRKNREGHWFWSVIFEHYRTYIDILVVSILLNLFAIVVPIYTRVVYDKVLPNLAFDTLWMLSIGVFLVLIFDLLFRFIRSYFIESIAKKTDISISSKIFSKILGMRMEVKPNSIGSFTRQLQEFESIREFFTSASISAMIDLPFAILFLVLIWIVAGSVVIVPISGVVVLIIYSIFIQGTLKSAIDQNSRLSSQRYAVLFESLSGLETLKLLCAQGRFQYLLEQSVAYAANWGIKSRNITDSIQYVATFVQQTVNIGIIIMGMFAVSDSNLTMGELVAATMLSGRAIAPMIQLSILSVRFNQAASSMETIDKIMELPTEQAVDKKYLGRQITRGKIELDDVSFSYPERSIPSIRNLSLTINPGEKVAIIGKIGSGKTTLERLILGLYKPTSGSIRLDGIDIEQWHVDSVRKSIGFVQQDDYLFYGSIRDNITLGKPFTTDSDVLDAIKRAGVDVFTDPDSEGLERPVGEGGRLLSGGQRQAITVARAMLGAPPILILDEPTSAMDNRAELQIKTELSKLSSNQTLVLITHKLSMLDVVDRIIVMDQGQIISDGPKDNILNNKKI